MRATLCAQKGVICLKQWPRLKPPDPSPTTIITANNCLLQRQPRCDFGLWLPRARPIQNPRVADVRKRWKLQRWQPGGNVAQPYCHHNDMIGRVFPYLFKEGLSNIFKEIAHFIADSIFHDLTCADRPRYYASACQFNIHYKLLLATKLDQNLENIERRSYIKSLDLAQCDISENSKNKTKAPILVK